MVRFTLKWGTKLSLILVSGVVLANLGACSASTVTPATSSSITPSATKTATIPDEVQQYAGDWPLPGKDYANTRATLDSEISAANVSQLGVAWAAPLPGAGLFGNASTTPLVLGDTVYIQDLQNNVFALDRNTGALKWEKMYGVLNIGPSGVAAGWNKLFTVSDPQHVVALDLATGNEIWKTKVSDIASVGMDIQPTVYNGMVFVSTVPGSSASNFYAGGGSGYIYALDQATGSIVWSFNTVDSANIWGNPQVNSGGGCWYPPAIDTASGLMYWGVGNPAPWPGTKDYPNGNSRPGPNLYTDSMLALDAASGQLKWYNQVVSHDIRDYDFQVAPMLATARINGTDRDIVIGAGKMGKVVAFDRQTGQTVWNVDVGKHQNDTLTEFTDQPVTVYPGFFGGVETPMAYSEGKVYVAVVNLFAEYIGSTTKAQSFKEGTGEFLALDTATGQTLWTKNLPAVNVGGATVVNDLVLTADFNGMVYAFNKNTGDQVWTWQAPGGINAWPSVAGDTIYWPVGIGATPSLVALKLGADKPVLSLNSPFDGSTVDAGDITVNAAVFNFKLVASTGQGNAPGEGHLHYFMDVDAPITSGKPAVTADGTWAMTEQPTYTWKNVAPGQHTFSVELVNNDHTPLNIPVTDKVTVTVRVPPSEKTIPPTGGGP
jgi:outer membrane protein assembly factor BamB